MKANEFVKNHGWKLVKDLIERGKDQTHVSNDSRMMIDAERYIKEYPWFTNDVDEMVSLVELKRLVESYELVKIHGLEKSKEIVANAPSDDHFYSWVLGSSGVKDKTVNIGKLRKAIADVESVESLKEMT